MKATIWEKEVDSAAASLDLKEVEQLFLANAPPPAAEARASTRLSMGRQKESPTSLLDTKLANNIEIALKHIRLGSAEIAAALTSGDR